MSMLPCFKKYMVAICAIAVALPVIASMVWPLMTGQLISATFGGMLLQFALFFGGMLLGYWIFSARADRVVDGYVYLYDQDCNPESFISNAGSVAANVQFPCNATVAWFMGIYAQACLDAGKPEVAARIEDGLRQSLKSAKKPADACGILVNLIPLVEKTGTLSDVRSLIEEGLSQCADDPSGQAAQRRQYLQSQLEIVNARQDGNYSELIKLDEHVMSMPSFPMRIRVEYAWDAASAAFRSDDVQVEEKCLSFVLSNGGGLALVSQAKKRMSALQHH